MANEIFKELKTRIALKTLDLAGWEAIKETYKPLKGEVCICEIPAGNNVPTANSVTPPTILFKVGDGVNFWKDLNWASALAADVYSWAKAPAKPVYEAGEITGIDQYIADYVNDQMGISVDTDTQYKLVKVNNYEYKLQMKGKTDSAWADVADSVIEIPADDTNTQYKVVKVDNYTYKLQSKEKDADAWVDVANSTITIPQDDTDTTYQIVKGADNYTYKLQSQAKGAAAWTDVSTFTIPADDTDTQYKIVKVDNDNYKLQSKALNGAWTDVEGGTIAVPATAVATLVGNDAGKSARAIAEEVTNAAVDALPDADEYSVVKAATATTGYAATYHLTKNGTNVGAAINIPKDMVVSKGEVITYETTGAWGKAGTYIVLTLANATNDVLYIAADSLIEYVRGASSDEIVMTVTQDHFIRGTLIDKSIAKGKLTPAVQASLDNADSAVQPGDLAEVINGTTPVAKATNADDADKLDGHDSTYFATKAASDAKLDHIKVELTNGDGYIKFSSTNAAGEVDSYKITGEDIISFGKDVNGDIVLGMGETMVEKFRALEENDAGYLQSVKVLGHTLTKTANEITVAQAKIALGLDSMAYENKDNYQEKNDSLTNFLTYWSVNNEGAFAGINNECLAVIQNSTLGGSMFGGSYDHIINEIILGYDNPHVKLGGYGDGYLYISNGTDTVGPTRAIRVDVEKLQLTKNGKTHDIYHPPVNTGAKIEGEELEYVISGSAEIVYVLDCN